MAETYPAKLPNASESFALSVKKPVLRSEFETGRARQRKRFENVNRKMKVRWEFTDNEYSMFEAFHRTKINYGADWFFIDLPATQGIQTVLARIVGGEFTAKHKGVLNWEVSATLEINNDYGLTEAELDALLA